MMTSSKDELPVKAFKTAQLFENWVAKNVKGKGIWLRVYKKIRAYPVLRSLKRWMWRFVMDGSMDSGILLMRNPISRSTPPPCEEHLV